jgi:hypothetical protein
VTTTTRPRRKIAKRSPEERERLAAQACVLKRNGDSISVIAETLGVAYSTVGDWVRWVDQPVAMVKYCEKCGDAFLAMRRDARKCPGGCESRRNREPHPEGLCLWCEGPINRKGAALYCCNKHLQAHYRELERQSKKRECAYCEQEFLPSVHHKKYCCELHARIDQADRRKKKPVVKRCAYCDKKFATAHQQKRYCCPSHQRQGRAQLLEQKTLALAA